ncbi:MAG TPA: porin family protein [Candidatus Eisenbacteria bacterium]
MLFRRVTLAGLIGGLILLVAPPAHAQVLIGYLLGEKLSTPVFNMGFEVGANFSKLDGFEEGGRRNGPVFGLFADWRFSEHVHLGGAILPIAGRGAKDLDPAQTGDAAIDGQTAESRMERSLGYVEIPLILKWSPHRQEGIRIGAGPSFGFVTGADDRYACRTPDGAPYTIERDIKGLIPGFDFGLSAEAEYRLEFLSIAVRYTQGLTDMRVEGTDEAVHTRVLTGTGRIYLGKKPAEH